MRVGVICAETVAECGSKGLHWGVRRLLLVPFFFPFGVELKKNVQTHLVLVHSSWTNFFSSVLSMIRAEDKTAPLYIPWQSNKLVLANPDKETFFALSCFPFIPPATLRQNAINSKQMFQLHFKGDKYFRSSEDLFKVHLRFFPLFWDDHPPLAF